MRGRGDSTQASSAHACAARPSNGSSPHRSSTCTASASASTIKDTRPHTRQTPFVARPRRALSLNRTAFKLKKNKPQMHADKHGWKRGKRGKGEEGKWGKKINPAFLFPFTLLTLSPLPLSLIGVHLRASAVSTVGAELKPLRVRSVPRGLYKRERAG